MRNSGMQSTTQALRDFANGNAVLFDDTGMEPVNENDKQHTLHSVPTKLCVLNHHPLY